MKPSKRESGPFNTVSVEDQIQKNKAAGSGKYMPYFSIESGETKIVRFLDKKPLTFFQHRVFDKTSKNGKGGYRMLTCSGRGCPLCESDPKPRFVGAYRVIDLSNVDQNGKKAPPAMKIFVKGTNTLQILERKALKKDITSENIEIERIGEGFDTQYIFEFTGDKKMPVIKKPENSDLQAIFAVDMKMLKRLSGGGGEEEEEAEEEEEESEEEESEEEAEESDEEEAEESDEESDEDAEEESEESEESEEAEDDDDEDEKPSKGKVKIKSKVKSKKRSLPF